VRRRRHGPLGTVALDGTKLAGNAAERANRTLAKLRDEVAGILRQADQADQHEDREHGDARGDELPAAPRRCWSAGRTPAGCAPRPPSPRWPGSNPIPASSGQVTRYRLNHGGDRQLNRALHTTLLVRLRTDPDTRADVARRTAEGKSRRDAKRCLRRVIARQLYRLLERYDRPGVEILRAA
jgi:hypothetical protein